LFGTSVRYSGASLGAQLSAAVAGGYSPLIATFLLPNTAGAPLPSTSSSWRSSPLSRSSRRLKHFTATSDLIHACDVDRGGGAGARADYPPLAVYFFAAPPAAICLPQLSTSK
jgi:hypothetical protein